MASMGWHPRPGGEACTPTGAGPVAPYHERWGVVGRGGGVRGSAVTTRLGWGERGREGGCAPSPAIGSRPVAWRGAVAMTGSTAGGVGGGNGDSGGSGGCYEARGARARAGRVGGRRCAWGGWRIPLLSPDVAVPPSPYRAGRHDPPHGVARCCWYGGNHRGRWWRRQREAAAMAAAVTSERRRETVHVGRGGVGGWDEQGAGGILSPLSPYGIGPPPLHALAAVTRRGGCCHFSRSGPRLPPHPPLRGTPATGRRRRERGMRRLRPPRPRRWNAVADAPTAPLRWATGGSGGGGVSGAPSGVGGGAPAMRLRPCPLRPPPLAPSRRYISACRERHLTLTQPSSRTTPTTSPSPDFAHLPGS